MQRTPALPLSAQDIQHKHRRATRWMWASCVALGISMLAAAAASRAEWSPLVPWLLWNHLLVIALCAFASFAIRRLPKRPMGAPAVPRPRDLLAPWVLAAGLITLVAVAAPWAPSIWDLGTTPDGQPVTSRQMHTSDDGRRYFETLNHRVQREITEAEYRQGEQHVWQMFARAWAVFSFGAVLMWRFVALRWQAEMTGEAAAATKPAAPLAAAEARPGWKVSAAVAALWTLGLGGNLLVLTQPSTDLMCMDSGEFDLPWFVLLLPPLMFGGFALFTKRAPFDAPWLAALVDERLGAGSYRGFIVRLKPLLLISVCGLVGVAALAAQCSRAGAGGLHGAVLAFQISACLSFALAHGLLRWRRIEGV